MNIDAAVNRPKLYAMEDGVVELMLGLSWVLAGGVFAISSRWPGFIFAAQAIWICVILGMAVGIRTLKERVTMPRGGYVGFEKRPRSTRFLMAAVFVFLALVYSGYAIIARGTSPFSAEKPVLLAIASGFPVVIGIIYVVIGLRYRLTQSLWSGGVSMLLGIWVYRSGSGMFSIPSVLVFEGAVVAIAGAVKLGRFMRRNPRVDAA